jgi:hypothetical protein
MLKAWDSGTLFTNPAQPNGLGMVFGGTLAGQNVGQWDTCTDLRVKIPSFVVGKVRGNRN